MGNRKRIEAEFQLPEVIIQHIQSFLSGKDAAQTTILSKSWYSAWLIRPSLDFDRSDFPDDEAFWKYVNTIAQRYEKLNLKIQNFRLWVRGINNASFSTISELISRAMKMGAIYVDIKSRYSSSRFTLSLDVLGSENLERLTVDGCKIDLGEDGKVSCSRLKSLSLSRMYLEGDILWDIISSCPLIESLCLTRCSFSNGSVLKLSPYVFHNLKCLQLCSVNVHTLFFHDWSSKFPCLKDLVVRYCHGYKDIKICSRSLECINFTESMMLSVKFDVPSIRKFTFSGNCIPLVSFVPAANNWESNISINCCCDPDAAWFVELNKLLTELSQSKVSLFLTFLFRNNVDYLEGDILWDIISSCPLIENLSLTGIKVSYRTQSSMTDLSPLVDFGKRNVGSVVDGPIRPYVFHNIKCLLLCSVKVRTLFFHDLSSKFPCLKDLAVRNSYGYKDIKICSRSLECISFTESMMLSVKFDVPSIRKFTFSGCFIPFLSFVPAANNWESDISINCGCDPDAAWFVELNKLLTKLSQSKVSLFLTFRNNVDYAEKIQGLPRPVVENLTVSLPYPACPGLWNSLFRCCRPLFVTDAWHSKLSIEYGGFSFLKWVYESLTQQMNKNCCNANANEVHLGSQCDLKEVNVEYFDGAVSVWRLLPWKSVLFNAQENRRKFRFHLRWGSDLAV